MLETLIKHHCSNMAMIPVNRPLISEEDISAVTEALKNTWISGDTPPIITLENTLKEILGVSDVVAVSTGTTAIDLSVEALDIQPGDECVVPTFTIVSSISNLLRHGAKLTVVDSDPITWSINADLAAEAITAKTKLVVPVHIYGLPVDMDPILKKSLVHRLSFWKMRRKHWGLIITVGIVEQLAMPEFSVFTQIK